MNFVHGSNVKIMNQIAIRCKVKTSVDATIETSPIESVIPNGFENEMTVNQNFTIQTRKSDFIWEDAVDPIKLGVDVNLKIEIQATEAFE